MAVGPGPHRSSDFVPETKTLTVRDDGCGIGDYQALFTLAESGWDAETIENEMPFGLGFLSALFSCQHLEVESKGGPAILILTITR